MTTPVATPPTRVVDPPSATTRLVAGVVRDRLGQEHYDRMRRGMLPHLGHLPAWGQITDTAREQYRRQTEYLVPAVLALLRSAGGAR